MINTCKHCRMQYYDLKLGYCCPFCKDVDKMRYEQIRAYLKHYPHSNAMQVAEALDISTYTVLKYVDEGALDFGRGEFEQI